MTKIKVFVPKECKLNYIYTLRVHPNLFNGLWDYLCHLYSTVGNGYEWKNGELTDNKNLNWNNLEIKCQKNIKILKKEKSEFLKTIKKKSFSENYPSTKDILDKIGLIDFHCDYNIIYPISQYSCINKIPKNIKVDYLYLSLLWLELAINSIPYNETSKYNQYLNNYDDYIKKYKEIKNNLYIKFQNDPLRLYLIKNFNLNNNKINYIFL